MPQPGEARGAAQLPGQGPLPARPVERVLEVLLGRRGAPGPPSSRTSSALMRSSSAMHQRSSLRSDRASASSIVASPWATCPTPARPSASAPRKAGVVRDEAGLAKLVERGAEQLESGDDIAALDEQDSLQTAAPGVPDGQRMPGRMVEQHRHRAFGCRQVAAPDRDQARDLQRAAHRQRVIARPRVLDIALRDAQGLIGKSLQPQDPRQDHAGHHPLVILKADGMRPVNGGDVVAEHALEVTPRVRLVSQVVQRGADQPIADGAGRP